MSPARSEIIIRPMCATCHHWAPRDDFPRVPGPQYQCARGLRVAGQAFICSEWEREPGADDEWAGAQLLRFLAA